MWDILQEKYLPWHTFIKYPNRLLNSRFDRVLTSAVFPKLFYIKRTTYPVNMYVPVKALDRSRASSNPYSGVHIQFALSLEGCVAISSAFFP